MNATIFYHTLSRFHMIIFTPPKPLKKTLFSSISLFFVFFSKTCQEHGYNTSKSIFLAEIHNIYLSWSVFSRLGFETFSKLQKFEKKKKNAKCNIWAYKGLWHTIGFPGFRMCLKLLFIFWKKKTEFRSKIFFSRKLRILHIWYSSFIFPRISRHTLVLDTYFVTYNTIKVHTKLAAISVPLHWRYKLNIMLQQGRSIITINLAAR